MSAVAKTTEKTGVEKVFELAMGARFSVEELVKLSMMFADAANAQREPDQGNRAYTFVRTYYDCEFAHPVFFQKQLPSNEEARKLQLEVPVLHPMTNEYRVAKLVNVVHDAFGHPVAHVRFRDGGDIWPCSFNSAKQMWRADPD